MIGWTFCFVCQFPEHIKAVFTFSEHDRESDIGFLWCSQDMRFIVRLNVNIKLDSL